MAKSRFRLDRTLGPLVVEWIERELVHGPGDVQGQRIELDDEQVRFLLRAYEVDDRGRRVVRRAVYSRAKGRAKSELLAMVACAESLGPVRFGGWEADGLPRGMPVMAPLIRLAATEETQTDNAYGGVQFMLKEGAVSRTAGLDVGLTRTYTPGGGKIVPITAKSSSKDGGKETFSGFDETHLFIGQNLVDLHATIRRNLAKRKQAEPWSLETSTMYAPGEESVAEMSHRYWQAVQDGTISDPSFLFDHREGPAEFDFDDDDQLRAAIREAYGAAADWIDVERLVAEARDPQSSQGDFRRYFLNLPTSRDTGWLSPAQWGERADPREPPADGADVVLGFDGSYNRDSTALVGCTVGTKPHLFVVAAWERPAKVREWVVPRGEVHAAVDDAVRRWNVRELVGDRSKWFDEFEQWADRYGSPPVAEFPQTRPMMAEACGVLYGAVMNGEVSHDGNPDLARHVGNAVTKETADGAYITKDGRNSPRKIDLAVAAVMAFRRAVDPNLSRSRSKYEEGDLLAV